MPKKGIIRHGVRDYVPDDELGDYVEVTVEMRERLVEALSLVVAGKRGMVEGVFMVAEGLKRIHDEKLYLAGGYSNFKSYCAEVIGISGQWAYQYIKIANRIPRGFLDGIEQFSMNRLLEIARLPDEALTEFVEDVKKQKPEHRRATFRKLSEMRDKEFKRKMRELREKHRKELETLKRKLKALPRTHAHEKLQEQLRERERLVQELRGQLAETKALLDRIQRESRTLDASGAGKENTVTVADGWRQSMKLTRQLLAGMDNPVVLKQLTSEFRETVEYVGAWYQRMRQKYGT